MANLFLYGRLEDPSSFADSLTNEQRELKRKSAKNANCFASRTDSGHNPCECDIRPVLTKHYAEHAKRFLQVRYCVLLVHGGVYLDAELLKPLDIVGLQSQQFENLNGPSRVT